jgi:hypothetical protein
MADLLGKEVTIARLQYALSNINKP